MAYYGRRKWFKVLRKNAKMSQMMVGALSDLSGAHVSHFENGYVNLSDDALSRVAKTLGVTLEEMKQMENEYQTQSL